MAVKITCPKCQNGFMVAEAFSGSKIQCPQPDCHATLILGLKPEYKTQRLSVPPTPAKQKETSIREQAIAHLSTWLDIPASLMTQVLEMLDKPGEAYTIWKIPKGNGETFRQITAPSEQLKHIQRRILDRLLYRIPVSNAAHGFVPGRSIVTNASFHLKTAQAIFNIDLKDAFPSVSAQRIKNLYVRYLKIPLLHLGETVPHLVLDDAVEVLVKLTTYQNQLPQGGPCSGYLLNLACITLDKTIYRLIQKYGENYRYTRYADDITISAPQAIPESLREDVQKAIHNCGFQINPQKSHYAEKSRGRCLEITGLILEKDQIRIPPKKLDEFRAIIHKAASTPPEQLPPENRLEVQSIMAFVKMVYERVPYRIWKPYAMYMEKFGVPYPKKPGLCLNFYPKTGPSQNSSESGQAN